MIIQLLAVMRFIFLDNPRTCCGVCQLLAANQKPAAQTGKNQQPCFIAVFMEKKGFYSC